MITLQSSSVPSGIKANLSLSLLCQGLHLQAYSLHGCEMATAIPNFISKPTTVQRTEGSADHHLFFSGWRTFPEVLQTPSLFKLVTHPILDQGKDIILNYGESVTMTLHQTLHISSPLSYIINIFSSFPFLVIWFINRYQMPLFLNSKIPQL